MKQNKINVCCPYCGSNDISAICKITISGKLQPDGKIKINSCWNEMKIDQYSTPSCDSNSTKGYCHTCGKECDFTWEAGFIKSNNNEEAPYNG